MHINSILQVDHNLRHAFLKVLPATYDQYTFYLIAGICRAHVAFRSSLLGTGGIVTVVILDDSPANPTGKIYVIWKIERVWSRASDILNPKECAPFVVRG